MKKAYIDYLIDRIKCLEKLLKIYKIEMDEKLIPYQEFKASHKNNQTSILNLDGMVASEKRFFSSREGKVEIYSTIVTIDKQVKDIDELSNSELIITYDNEKWSVIAAYDKVIEMMNEKFKK